MTSKIIFIWNTKVPRVWVYICIQHGVCGCIDTADHSAQCQDCNNFLRSAQALRQWFRNRHNDMCRGFERVLPECIMLTLCVLRFRTTLLPRMWKTLWPMGTQRRNGLQCEDGKKWFTLPPGLSGDDFPDVFECGLQWWDWPDHKTTRVTTSGARMAR